MENIKTIGIKQLKNKLSDYLQEVKSGMRILITDHDEWVAELREPQMSFEDTADSNINADDPSLRLFLNLSAEARAALVSELYQY